MTVYERLLNWMLQTGSRVLPGPFLASVVYIFYKFADHFLNAIQAPPEILASEPSAITSSFLFTVLRNSLVIFFALLIPNVILDISSIAFGNWLQDLKLYLIGKFKIASLLIDSLKNTTTISVDRLDEFIKNVYEKSNGEIALYKPDSSAFVEKAVVGEVVSKKLLDGSIRKVVIYTSIDDRVVFDKYRTRHRLSDGQVVIHVRDELGSTCERYIERKALYFRSTSKGSYQISYLMLRPVCAPYNDKYVIIKSGRDLKNLPEGRSDLYIETINSFPV